MTPEKVRLLIVEARFYDDLADELLRGASDVISAHGAGFDVVSVPGALEIPGAIAMAHEARLSPLERERPGAHGPDRPAGSLPGERHPDG